MAKAAVNIDLGHLKQTLKEIGKSAKEAMKLIDDAVTEAAYDIDLAAKETIQKGTRTGRTYRRRSVSHQASAAGEPPKTDSGRLASSIRPKIGFMAAEVGSLKSVAKYGGYLEDGTKHKDGSEAIAPRPLFGPLETEWSPLIALRVDNAIQASGL